MSLLRIPSAFLEIIYFIGVPSNITRLIAACIAVSRSKFHTCSKVGVINWLGHVNV